MTESQIDPINNDYDPNHEYKILSIDDINAKIQNDGDRQRAHRILDTNKQLSLQLVHYNKLAIRWTFFNILLRLVGHGLSVVASILVAIFSSKPDMQVPISVNLFLGIYAAVESFMTEVIARFFTSRRKNYYISKNDEIKAMQNRANYFINKAIEDEVITNDEMSDFIKLINNDINKMKNEDKIEAQSERDDFLEKMKQIASDLAMKEFQKTTIKSLKNAELQKLNQKYQIGISL